MKEVLKKMFTKDEITYYLVELLKIDKKNLATLKKMIRVRNDKLFGLFLNSERGK